MKRTTIGRHHLPSWSGKCREYYFEKGPDFVLSFFFALSFVRRYRVAVVYTTLSTEHIAEQYSSTAAVENTATQGTEWSSMIGFLTRVKIKGRRKAEGGRIARRCFFFQRRTERGCTADWRIG